MSGIAGIFSLDRAPIALERLGQMVDILAHRGPDGVNVWLHGAIGLGHRLLWTTPESVLERQPLVSRTGYWVLTADARIDNREELIAALNLADYSAANITDSELILAAYEKWQESCVERLLGDFAFAIWDDRNQQLFCARDSFGVKPLFYYYQPGKLFVFASEIKALFCLPEVPCEVNEAKIGTYLQAIEDQVTTFYRGITALPPAHCLTVRRKTLCCDRYWSPDPSRELRLSSDAEYAEAYLEVLTNAVQRRMRSAFPIACGLSGGLDSSSVTCVARKLLQHQGNQLLPTFSLVFDKATASDERPYIEAVLAQGGVTSHYVHGDEITPLTDWQQVMWHMECPVPHNLFLSWGLAAAAQQQNIRVFLDGLAGDDVVSHGFEHLMELAYTGRLISLVKECYALNRSQAWQELRHHLWYYTVAPRLPLNLREPLRQLFGGKARSSTPRINPLINPDFAQAIELDTQIKGVEQRCYRDFWTAKEYHCQALLSDGITLGLELNNKIAAAFAQEVYSPFTDRALAEFCLAIPSGQKLHNGLTRMIVRRALVDLLPEKVRWRTDKGRLFACTNYGLLNTDREQLEHLIFDHHNALAPYINIPVLQAEYQQYRQNPNLDRFPKFWPAVSVALWLQTMRLDPLQTASAPSVLCQFAGGDA